MEGIALILHGDDGERTYIVPEGLTQIYVPSEYSPETQTFEEEFYGDIALIRVPELRNLDIEYPRLPKSREEVKAGTLLVAAGVGLDETQREADQLEFVSVDMISDVGITPDFTPWPIGTLHGIPSYFLPTAVDVCEPVWQYPQPSHPVSRFHPDFNPQNPTIS